MTGILVVCSANVCRSPLAAFALQEALAPSPLLAAVPVASAGVRVEASMPVCAEVAALHDGDRWRERAAAHRSRAATVEEVLPAALVLTASRGIRSSVVAAVPEARRRVFTLREALWLGAGYVGDDAPEEDPVAAFCRYIDGRRGLLPPPREPRALRWLRSPHHPLDIPDGHLRRGAPHRETVRRVDAAARELAALLRGQPSARA